ncbi:hypothetical protein [Massilia psychrophila]|uniref:hypothetical protein n=1 Tax=Massilia psychrophila TaxID=1603353 RepID=UPI0015D51025|nr:hypothetical protein [Massilia psychrophila]GGE64432.1 hypothetical protein GCM10008020_05790 [Massilia psychrophila]
MNIISLLLPGMFIMLGTVAGAAPANEPDQHSCHSSSGRCPPPPLPPEPPVPPAPPAPPPLPAVPTAAHAACAAKTAGTLLTYVVGKGETMTGMCEREGGKMQFLLRSYALKD